MVKQVAAIVILVAGVIGAGGRPAPATEKSGESPPKAAKAGARTMDAAALAAEVRAAGWIFFSAKAGDNWDLVVMRPDGSERRKITDTPDTNEAGVRVSPDGKKILYYRMDKKTAVANNTYGNYELVIADADGGNPVSYGKGFVYAAWGPDGKQLAYLEKGGIKILDLETRKVVRELPRLRLAQQLCWSADGKWFCATANNLGPYWNIGRVSAQTGAVNVVSEIDRYNCTPDWVPDSRRIVYARGIIPQEGGQAEMWVANGDGTGRHVLYAEDGMNIYGACASPDGKYLIFTRSVEDMGSDDAVGTRLTLIRWADTPMIGPGSISERARKKYPQAKPGPMLDLGQGWEPHWTNAAIAPAAKGRGPRSNEGRAAK
jgi:Tol biopolymer transport system component